AVAEPHLDYPVQSDGNRDRKWKHLDCEQRERVARIDLFVGDRRCASTAFGSATWNASTSAVSGYNVYRSTVSGSGYTKINSSLVVGLSYSDTTVLNSTTYYYVTTAVDSSSVESSYSNQVSAPVP